MTVDFLSQDDYKYQYMIQVTSSLVDKKDVRSKRLELKLGQRELALRAGVSLHQLSQCERGLLLPDALFFKAIARILDTNPTDLCLAQEELAQKVTPGEGYVTAQSEKSYKVSRSQLFDPQKIAVLDLFCGIGGFSHGFERTGAFEVAFGVDLLSDRITTFTANHPAATAWCEDINDLSLASLSNYGPAPRIIIGGPPCQGFSSIRPFRNLTEGDKRNNLFEHFILAVECFRPEWFVMENVVGLLTHKAGATLQHIVDLFTQIGYSVDWRILNAALYGLPQRRERLLLVGNRQKKCFVWPAPTHFFDGRSMAGRYGQKMPQDSLFDMPLLPAVTVMEAINDLPPVSSGQSANYYRNDVIATAYQRLMRGTEDVLRLHDATEHSSRMLEIIRHAGSNKSALPKGLVSSGFSSSYSRLDPNKPAVTLTVNFVHPASNKCIHPYQDRALTPREGARLQSFEDAFLFKGKRAQIVKQIGNAVPPILGQVIAEAILAQW